MRSEGVIGRNAVGQHATLRNYVCGLAALLIAAAVAAPAFAQSDNPIKIGFSLALTGPLAPNGKQALLGAKIWQ
jgi:branched-chain amino acid transport system substrate-binding protein